MASEGDVMPVYSSEKALTISSVESEWVKVRLGDMCEIYQPETISKKEMCSNGAFPVFGANGKIGYYDRYNHEKPEVLVCCRGATCGTVNMSEPRSWITGNAMVVHPKDEQLNQSFLYYLLMGGVSLSKCITGTAQPQITKANLTPVKIPLPPLPEQRRISTLLGSIEKAIDLERRCEESLTTIKRAAMHVVFTPANTAGWVKVKLGDVCVIERGSSPRPIKSFLTTHSDGVNWIKIRDVSEKEKFVIQTKEKITLEGAKKSRRVFPGDLILTNSMSYGRPYIVKIEGCIHDGWFVLRSKQSIYTDCLYYILLSPLTQKQFGNLAYGSVVQNVNGDLVKSVSFPLPPLQEQQEIVDFLTTLDQKLDIHRRKRACLENIFRLFLPNLTRGTLRFTELPEGCF